MFEIVALIVLGGLGWLWYDSARARDVGIEAARHACAAEDLQFLDDTVAITSLKPVRDDDGRLAWQRIYAFEYSDTGDNRRPGRVVLLGHRVTLLNVGLRLARPEDALH